eukprot:TRINITY_DN19152_c0_g1_i1.p1 TRINITY_DN19152_c0_g1~~TRINITY_DN19152_c0_g1_i1.p1  ORF type:complete len:749 (+),score=93.79 TRINITY_DN19152_c0_g1_i1:56-2302(+)
MILLWISVGALMLGMIGDEDGQRVFFTTGVTFSEGPTLKAGEIAVVVRAPDDKDTVLVRTNDGIVFDAGAGAQLISIIPPMQLGDRVEIYPHSSDIPQDQLKFQQQTGVISSIYENKAEIQFFAHPHPVSMQLSHLVPECYGRGQRDYDSPGSDCSCSPTWSGRHCLTPATKSDESVFAKLRNFLIGSPDTAKESVPERGSHPQSENVTEVLWNGFQYSGIIEATSVNLKFVLRSASFTVVLACAIWEPLCGVALDTLSASNLTGVPEPEEDRKLRRTRNECNADDAIQLTGPVRVRKAWMDTSLIDTATKGPWTTVFRGPDYYRTYEGPINSPTALSQFMASIMADHSIIRTPHQLKKALELTPIVTFFSTEFADLFKDAKQPLFFETIDNPVELLSSATFDQLGIQVMHPATEDPCEYDAVVLIRATHDKKYLQYCYPRQGNGANKNLIYRWVTRTAVPVVSELAPSNFEEEVRFSLQHSTTMLILPTRTSNMSLQQFEQNAFEVKLSTIQSSIRCYTLSPSRSADFLNRFGHSNLVVLIPFVELCGYLDAFPSSAEAALKAMKTTPPPEAYSDKVDPTGLKYGIITLSAREVAELPVADCTLGSSSFTKVLLVVRTSWCWHCRVLLPTIEDLGRTVPDTPGLLLAQHVADESIPTWLDRHIEGYPEILLLDFSSSCSNPTVTRYKGDDRNTAALLHFAASYAPTKLPLQPKEKSDRLNQLRKKGRDAARHHMQHKKTEYGKRSGN